MRFRALDVLGKKTLVEINGAVYVLHNCGRTAGKPTAPYRGGGVCFGDGFLNPLGHIEAFIKFLARSRTSDRLVVLGLTSMVALGVVAVLYVIVSAAGNGSGDSADENASEFLAKFERTVPRKPAPDAPFVDPEGKTVTLQDQMGRVTLVNLWATWCGPCQIEMPSLERLQAQLGSDDFEVMIISVDRAGLKKSAEKLEEWGIRDLKTHNDKTFAVAKALGAEGLPVTVLFDAEGNEIGRLAGKAEWDEPEVISFIEDYLPAS